MPVAERNDEIPQGQAKGKASEQAEFIDATGGQTPLTAAAPVNEPIPIQPQVLGAFTEPDVEVDDVVNPGEELDPDLFGAMLEPGPPVPSDDEDLRVWLPTLERVAAQPGVSPGMRALVVAIRDRLEE